MEADTWREVAPSSFRVPTLGWLPPWLWTTHIEGTRRHPQGIAPALPWPAVIAEPSWLIMVRFHELLEISEIHEILFLVSKQLWDHPVALVYRVGPAFPTGPNRSQRSRYAKSGKGKGSPPPRSVGVPRAGPGVSEHVPVARNKTEVLGGSVTH